MGNLLNDVSPFNGVATAVVIPVTSGSWILENAGHTRVGVLLGGGMVVEEYGLAFLNGAGSANFGFVEAVSLGVGWIGSAASWVA